MVFIVLATPGYEMRIQTKLEDLRPGHIIEWANDGKGSIIHGIVLQINDYVNLHLKNKNVIVVLVEGQVETSGWFSKDESVCRLAITKEN